MSRNPLFLTLLHKKTSVCTLYVYALYLCYSRRVLSSLYLTNRPKKRQSFFCTPTKKIPATFLLFLVGAKKVLHLSQHSFLGLRKNAKKIGKGYNKVSIRRCLLFTCGEFVFQVTIAYCMKCIIKVSLLALLSRRQKSLSCGCFLSLSLSRHPLKVKRKSLAI